MEWDDEGVVLSARTMGETSVVLSLLTGRHGRHSGMVRGGVGRRARGVLQPGNRVACRWRGRLAEHLGAFGCELTTATAPAVLEDAARLAAVVAACAVLDTALPEREPLPVQYEALLALLQAVEHDPAWPAAYVRWEVALLADLGFGLDLAACALTGATDGLVFVSPRTGRAVSAEAAVAVAAAAAGVAGFPRRSGGAGQGRRYRRRPCAHRPFSAPMRLRRAWAERCPLPESGCPRQ